MLGEISTADKILITDTSSLEHHIRIYKLSLLDLFSIIHFAMEGNRKINIKIKHNEQKKWESQP